MIKSLLQFTITLQSPTVVIARCKVIHELAESFIADYTHFVEQILLIHCTESTLAGLRSVTFLKLHFLLHFAAALRCLGPTREYSCGECEHRIER